MLLGLFEVGSCFHHKRTAPHKPMVMQYLRYKKKKASVSEKKEFPLASLIKMQYSFCISGNRGYVSNRIRFFPPFFLFVSTPQWMGLNVHYCYSLVIQRAVNYTLQKYNVL